MFIVFAAQSELLLIFGWSFAGSSWCSYFGVGVSYEGVSVLGLLVKQDGGSYRSPGCVSGKWSSCSLQACAFTTGKEVGEAKQGRI